MKVVVTELAYFNGSRVRPKKEIDWPGDVCPPWARPKGEELKIRPAGTENFDGQVAAAGPKRPGTVAVQDQVTGESLV